MRTYIIIQYNSNELSLVDGKFSKEDRIGGPLNGNQNPHIWTNKDEQLIRQSFAKEYQTEIILYSFSTQK